MRFSKLFSLRAAAVFLLLGVIGGCGYYRPPPEQVVYTPPPEKDRLEFNQDEPTQIASFETNTDSPRGVVFQKGQGAKVTSPIFGRVRFAGLTEDKKYVGMKIEDDLGFWVLITCHEKIHVPPNQKVTPFTVIADEGSKCGIESKDAKTPRSHITLHLPPFARDFGTYDDTYTAGNGVEYIIADPHKYAEDGKQIRYFAGDNGSMWTLVYEASARLDQIGREFDDTHMGWFLNRTRERRPFLRAMVLYRMWQTGTLEPKAKKRVENYLRWHSAIKIPVYLPYPAPDFAIQYAKPKPNPRTADEIEALWEKKVSPFLEGRDNDKALKALLEFRKDSPFQGEAGTAFQLGYVYSLLDKFENAVEHMMIAEALGEVHYWNTPEKVSKFKYYTTDLLMKTYWSARELDIPKAFTTKRKKYKRWANVPW